jgi:nucleotide-binding universal stress UspA family protein
LLRRILVPLDGSILAEAALPVAAHLAHRSGAAVRMVTVADSGWAQVRGEWSDAPLARARRYIEGEARKLAALDVEASTTVRSGSVVDEILDEADELAADLIVMATHGRGPLSRFWLGSVADRCLRQTNRPVLLVRPEGASVLPAETRRIVVALDGSTLSERALGPAVAMAKLIGVDLTLLRIETVEEARAQASVYLAHLADGIGEWGGKPRAEVLIGDAVAPALIGAVEGDLIVMATHARRGLNRAFLGSVADMVVRGCDGPVLVVPPENTHSGGGMERDRRRGRTSGAALG